MAGKKIQRVKAISSELSSTSSRARSGILIPTPFLFSIHSVLLGFDFTYLACVSLYLNLEGEPSILILVFRASSRLCLMHHWDLSLSSVLFEGVAIVACGKMCNLQFEIHSLTVSLKRHYRLYNTVLLIAKDFKSKVEICFGCQN